MMELVDKRMEKSSKPQPGEKNSQRTGRQTLKLLLADDEPEAQESEQQVQPRII